jgi:hypothetical protein
VTRVAFSLAWIVVQERLDPLIAEITRLVPDENGTAE